MKEGNLTTKQFVAIALIIVICGFLIAGSEYFLAKKESAYQKMSLILSQQPEFVEEENEPVPIPSNNNSDRNNDKNDTSGRVKRKPVTYNYVGRLKIPNINFNRGFLNYGSSGNNVDQNIAVLNGSSYPDDAYSNMIIAGHNGSRWNAFFTNLDKLSLGDDAYITYKGVEYHYKLVKKYKDKQKDGATIYRHSNKKQLTLITCKRPDYKKYYLILVFELVEERNL